MKIIKWFKSNPKMSFFILMTVIALGLLLFTRSCANKQQQRQEIVSAIAQSKIDGLQSDLKLKEKQLYQHKMAEDSLWVTLGYVNKQLSTYKAKYAVIASDLATELNNNHELTNDESVKRFVGNSGCDTIGERSEVPICSIRYYNDINSELKSTKNTVSVLVSESGKKDSKITVLEGIITEKDNQNNELVGIVSDSKGIISQQSVQIEADKKILRNQKIKTWCVGGVGLVFTVLAIVF